MLAMRMIVRQSFVSRFSVPLPIIKIGNRLIVIRIVIRIVIVIATVRIIVITIAVVTIIT